MITPDDRAHLGIMGSDLLREYRDAVIEILAQRNVTSDNIARDNVHVEIQHRQGRGEYVTLTSFVLHPRESDQATGVMINRESTRDHLWIEARWL